MTADELFEKVRAAAVAATGPDERALQIDYQALKLVFARRSASARWH